jgi:hypothetical protein
MSNNPIDVICEAIRDLNHRLEIEQKRNDDLTIGYNDLLTRLTKIEDTIWPKSHTMKPEDLDQAFKDMAKGDPIKGFARDTKDLDAFHDFANRGGEFG